MIASTRVLLRSFLAMAALCLTVDGVAAQRIWIQGDGMVTSTNLPGLPAGTNLGTVFAVDNQGAGSTLGDAFHFNGTWLVSNPATRNPWVEVDDHLPSPAKVIVTMTAGPYQVTVCISVTEWRVL
ncbi:MAG: hypothetical protein AAF628_29700 [Planctomycetota bacterium]